MFFDKGGVCIMFEGLMVNAPLIAGIVVGILIVIFGIKYLTNKCVISGALVKMVLDALIAVEDELIALFGEKFGVIIDILEDVLEALTDSQLSEAEAYSLAMTMITEACAAAKIKLTKEQKIILGFVVKKMIKLIIEYKRPDVVATALVHMNASNVRISSLRITAAN